MHTIVVGVDGSPHADHAVRWAIVQARSAGAELHLVHAYGRRTGADGPAAAQAAADAALAGIVDRHRDDLDGVGWRARAQSAGRGSAARVLLDEAQHADLIVVGSRGLGGFGELVLGSTSYRLVSWAHTPTAVVRTATTRAWAPADRFTRGVVVGVDGSDVGDRALRWAATEARRRGVALDVVHAEPLPPHQLYAISAVPSMDRQRALVREEGEQIIDRAVQRVGAVLDGLSVRRHAQVGPPASELAAVAGTDHVIVVGTRGHSYVGGVMLGSVSHQVLHHAEAPVIVVP